jgi:TATA-box binding protein (TBP) (component of TFIID and TFIIIB)
MSESHFSDNLHISTMVQICKLNTKIELKPLAENLIINDNIIYIEHGSTTNKGHNNKKISKKKSLNKKYFYNQVTLHIFNEHKANKRVNVKIFNNGRIQMTGINSELVGLSTMEILLKEFNLLENKKEIFDLEESEESEESIKQSGDLETVLINSDFDIHAEVNREALHRNIVGNGYLSSYEPCNYPGVNIKYYYNPLRKNYGICDCEKPCNGKGLDNTCKKITCAVFKSGKIIITGARSKTHLQTAYEFISEFIGDNREDVLKLK